MRVLLLLLALAVIGVGLAQWLGHKPPAPATPQTAQSSPTPPAVPTRPQDVKAFGQDLNRFMEDTAAQRARQEPQQ
jgi:hypothetical protein